MTKMLQNEENWDPMYNFEDFGDDDGGGENSRSKTERLPEAEGPYVGPNRSPELASAFLKGGSKSVGRCQPFDQAARSCL